MDVLAKIHHGLECPICAEMMYVPLTCLCGHTFCYECIDSWFDTKMNCPTCRTEMEQPPVMNIALRDIVTVVVNLAIDVEIDEDRKAKLIRAKENASKNYIRITALGEDIFGDKFKNTTLTLIDRSDGVARCGNCHWEAHGSRCINCGTRFRMPRDDDYYDSEADEDYSDDDQEQFTVNGIEGDDLYSDDSFVVYTDDEAQMGTEGDPITVDEDDDEDFHSVDSVEFEGFSDTESDFHSQHHHDIHHHHNSHGDDAMWPEDESGGSNTLISSLTRAVDYFHSQTESLETPTGLRSPGDGSETA